MTEPDSSDSVARLRRDGPIRYDTYRNSHGEDEPRLVWHYRPATGPTTAETS